MDSLLERYETPSINSLFSNSRLTNRALIIVEGKDDIQFYNRISSELCKTFKFRAIENIKNYTEGCDEIIKLTRDFQDKLNEEEINKKFFLSIIDNDARRFRISDNLEMDGLFILKHYSYESHYYTIDNFKKLILDLTQTEFELLDHKVLNELDEEIKNQIVENLYLPSLESLKNAVEQDYDNLIGYSTAAGEILNNSNLLRKLKKKEKILEQFSCELGLQKNYDNIKNIAKGKWILASYSKNAYQHINFLSEKCRKNEINQCQFCSIGKYEKCLYKLQLRLQEGPLIEMIRNIIDKNELAYIIQRFSELN